MSIDTLNLFKMALQQTNIFSHDEQENLESISTVLATQYEVIKNIFIFFQDNQQSFEYKPLLGAPLIIRFDEISNKFTIEREPLSVELSNTQFNSWLACCDFAFSTIYPIGTTLSLDQDLLPTEIKQRYEWRHKELLVTIIGRKIPFEENNFNGVIDYLGVLYPIGVIPETSAIMINNMMIKEVKFRGFVTDDEKEFVNMLKNQQLKEARVSTVFFAENLEE